MDKIREFVEAMFSSLPRTKEAAEMRVNIQNHMEERYQELLEQGKSENEALGTVIAEFGSVEELRRELDNGDTGAAVPADPTLAAEFEGFKRRSAWMVALAVVLFILSPTIVLLFETLHIPENIGNIVFFIPVAAATGLLVYVGSQENDYKRRLGVSKQSAEQSGEQKEDPIVGMVAILATIVFLLIGFLWNAWHPGWIVFLLVPAVACVRGTRR